jgi:hypothetical protein
LELLGLFAHFVSSTSSINPAGELSFRFLFTHFRFVLNLFGFVCFKKITVVGGLWWFLHSQMPLIEAFLK